MRTLKKEEKKWEEGSLSLDILVNIHQYSSANDFNLNFDGACCIFFALFDKKRSNFFFQNSILKFLESVLRIFPFVFLANDEKAG